MIKNAPTFDTEILRPGTAVRLSKSSYGYLNILIISSSLENIQFSFIQDDHSPKRWVDLLNAEFMGHSIYSAWLPVSQFSGSNPFTFELLKEA